MPVVVFGVEELRRCVEVEATEEAVFIYPHRLGRAQVWERKDAAIFIEVFSMYLQTLHFDCKFFGSSRDHTREWLLTLESRKNYSISWLVYRIVLVKSADVRLFSIGREDECPGWDLYMSLLAILCAEPVERHWKKIG